MSQALWDINSISWKLVLCLLASWTMVYLSIVKGVTSLGKVAYFTAIFPYVVSIVERWDIINIIKRKTVFFQFLGPHHTAYCVPVSGWCHRWHCLLLHAQV